MAIWALGARFLARIDDRTEQTTAHPFARGAERPQRRTGRESGRSEETASEEFQLVSSALPGCSPVHPETGIVASWFRQK
jgi:hypothetical protein